MHLISIRGNPRMIKNNVIDVIILVYLRKMFKKTLMVFVCRNLPKQTFEYMQTLSKYSCLHFLTLYSLSTYICFPSCINKHFDSHVYLIEFNFIQ